MKTKIFKLLCITLCLCCVFNLSACCEWYATSRGTEWENEFMTVYVPESGSPTGTLTIDGVTYNISLKCRAFDSALIYDDDFETQYDESGNYLYEENNNGFGARLWVSEAKIKRKNFKKSELHIEIQKDNLYKTGRSKVDYTGKTVVLYRKA